MCLNLMWRSEANNDKFCNTQEWVQIIAEETSMKLAAIKNVISLSGSFPRQRQMETHGQRTSPFPWSFLRQLQTETSRDQSSGDSFVDTVRRTTVYDNGHKRKYACLQYPKGVTRDHVLNDNRTAQNNIGQSPAPNTHKSSHSIPRLMDIYIPAAHSLLPNTIANQEYLPRIPPS